MRNFLYSLFCFLSLTAQGQYMDVGANIGMANYLGDLTPPEHLFVELNTGLGVHGRYNMTPHLSLRSQVTIGRISGDDKHSSLNSGRLRRNLNFRSRIWEAALLAEVNILPLDPQARKRNLVPYAFAGLAFFHFRPQAQYSFEWVDLQPLSTEGQGFAEYPDRQPYQLWQWSIPFGGGIKLALNKGWIFGVEVGLRKTFTDYLDDVSNTYVNRELVRAYKGDLAATLSNRATDSEGDPIELQGEKRGSPAGKDWYTFSGITISKILTTRGPLFYPKNKKKRKGNKQKKGGDLNRDF